MGCNGGCGCGGGCEGNGNGRGAMGAPRANMKGRTQMPGPFLVRKPKALTNAEGPVTGDGKGSENPVPVAGANQVVLLIDANRGTGPSDRDLDLYMEISVNGTDFYRETNIASGATATVSKKTYQITDDQITNPGDDRLALAIGVMAAFARFTFDLSGGTGNDYSNVAARAITGRV